MFYPTLKLLLRLYWIVKIIQLVNVYTTLDLQYKEQLLLSYLFGNFGLFSVDLPHNRTQTFNISKIIHLAADVQTNQILLRTF